MWGILLWFLIISSIIILPFLISMAFWFLYYYFRFDMRLKKGDYEYVGHGSILKR